MSNVTRTNQTRNKNSGICPACRYKVRLRVNGTIGSHHIWSGQTYIGRCKGTGLKPLSNMWRR